MLILLLFTISNVYAHRQRNALVNQCYDIVLDNCGVLILCQSLIQSFSSG